MARLSNGVALLGIGVVVAGVAVISNPNEQAHVDKIVREKGAAWAIGAGIGNVLGTRSDAYANYVLFSLYRTKLANGTTGTLSWGAFGYVGVTGN
jgi:hypothetical protein